MIVRPIEDEDLGEKVDEQIEMESRDRKEPHEEVVVPDKLVLMAQPLNGHVDSQRVNLFCTRVSIQGKVGIATIDGGRCVNLASTILVQKLGLPTQRHPKPYGMKWINGMIIPRVEEQVWVPFSIGWYADVVLCDVVSMPTCHVLLGRPWQYDRGVYHDGRENTYSFRFNNLVVFLQPLSFAQIKADELGMKTARVNQSNDLLIPQPYPSTCHVYHEVNRRGHEDEDLRANLFQEGEYDMSSGTRRRERTHDKGKCRVGCLRMCCARSRLNPSPKNREKRKKKAGNRQTVVQAFHRTHGVQFGLGSPNASYGLGNATKAYEAKHGPPTNVHPGWSRVKRRQGEGNPRLG